jgi:hypothetical protein
MNRPFNQPSRLSHSKSRQPRRSRLSVEALEDRLVPASLPILYTTATESRGDFANTAAAARPVSLGAVMETQVTGHLSTAADHDFMAVTLKPGQVFTASVDHMGTRGAPKFKLSLLDKNAAAVADAGLNGDLAYRVPTGTSSPSTYYVKLSPGLGATKFSLPYTLHLRPIGLDNTIKEAKWLQQTTGGMYTWLDGNVLNISGPTGHGFGVRGAWTQSTTGSGNSISSTYTAAGTVHLQTAAGDVAMSIPAGNTLSVSTLPHSAGHLFGEVSAIAWNASVSLAQLATTFGVTAPFGGDLARQTLVVNVSTNLSNPAGVKLGREKILQQTGAPLNAAVPYLYFTVNPLAGGAGGGMTNVLSIVADPADPFLYVGSGLVGVPIPGTPIAINALGYSKQGLIPFTPQAKPTQWNGNLSGHFYLDASVFFPIAGIPCEVQGNLTLDLDPRDTGAILGGVNVTADQLVKYLTKTGPTPLTASQVDAVFSNLSVGVNGTLKVGVLDKVFKNLFKGTPLADKGPKLAVGQASLIYDGPNRTGHFHGGTVNPLAGTPLQVIGSQQTLTVDGTVKGNGSAYLDLQGTYNLAGFPATGHMLLVNDYPLSPNAAKALTGKNYSKTVRTVNVTGILIEQKVGLLGASIDVTGRVLGNGDFSLKGSADVDFGKLEASAAIVLTSTQTSGVKLTATLAGSVRTDYVRGSLDASLTIARHNGNTTFGGSGRARVSVKTPWGWDNIGSVNVRVDGDDLIFSAGGQSIRIDMPG